VVIGQPPQRVLRIGQWRQAAIAGFLCVMSSREPGARPLPEAQRNRLLSAIAGVLVVAQASGPGEAARALAGIKPGKRVYVRVGGRPGPRSIPRGFEPIPVDIEAPSPTLEGWLMHVSASVVEAVPTERIQIRPLPLYRLFIDALSAVGHTVTAEEVADALGLVPKQAEAWLQKAVDDGLAHEADGRYLVSSAQEELPL
jgi:predicted Rossmann fold nucleotide-binding protein DprA/Smf involved in DNA uptake